MKPLVALSGLFYQVAMVRYIENALRRRDDIEVVTVGPDFGSWIPWRGGMHLRYQDCVLPVDVQTPPQGSNWTKPPVRFVEVRLRKRFGRLPDLWLQVDAGYHFVGVPAEGKNVVVATDPHCLNYDQQRLYAHTFYCMQQPYMQLKDEWLPYAYDPYWHRLIEADERPSEPEYAAALAGLVYTEREQWAQQMRRLGYAVFLDTGPSYQDARKLYARSTIGFNWSSQQDTVARVFELFAMGVPAVLNRVPDLMELFEEGEHFLGFGTLEEAVAQSKTLIDSPNGVRDSLAEAARKAVEPHTWDARVGRILKEAGLV